MRVALDTNILAYAEGVNGPDHQKRAAGLIDRLSTADVIIPLQVLGELLAVLTRKTARPRASVRSSVLSWRDGYEIVPTTNESFLRAIDLVADHQLPSWDAAILAVAAEARCQILLSEDMHDGFTWNGTVIANPFAVTPQPTLARFLRTIT